MNKPDWKYAPLDATHWDSITGFFCNKLGHFHRAGAFYPRPPVNLGAGRYVERPPQHRRNKMTKPADATHQCSFNGRFYKETDGQDYVWSDSGKWIKSIGLPLRGHSIILPLDVRNFDGGGGNK